jgi:hypothetical protein
MPLDPAGKLAGIDRGAAKRTGAAARGNRSVKPERNEKSEKYS